MNQYSHDHQLSESELQAARQLIRLALQEDLAEKGDLTSDALIDEKATGEVQIVSRQAGILAGTKVAELVFAELDPAVAWRPLCDDGARVEAGTVVANVSGPIRSLLTGERTALNFLTHLSGVAGLTRQFADAVSGTQAQILDTRKTLPGWRLLQKAAVRAGGGMNHRIGLYDGVLIKDNHLAAWAAENDSHTIAAAIEQARCSVGDSIPIEVEVDTLTQLEAALSGRPDIILLDNMDCVTLREAVAIRDATATEVLLEASGGVTLENVAEIARTGVDRVSIGALTHSVVAHDLAFDWKSD